MATYIVTGHPLNYADAGLSGPDADLVRFAPAGKTVTLMLPGPVDTKVKAAGVLR